MAEREAAKDSRDQSKQTEEAIRARMGDEGIRILQALIGDLFQKISAAAPAARRSQNVIHLGEAALSVWISSRVLAAGTFAQSRWDVLAWGSISVTQKKPEYVWSASLWHTNLGAGDTYRWYEVSYFTNPMAGRSTPFAPYALTDPREADAAAGPGMAVQQIAWGPKPIDDEDAPAFYDRWADLLAKACAGRLSHPRSLPLK